MEFQEGYIQHPDTPTFKETLLIYCFSGVLLFTLGVWAQFHHLLSGLVISQLAFIVAPAILYTSLRRYSFSQTFRLVPIRFKTIVLTIITTSAAFVLVGLIAALQEMIRPHSEAYQEIWKAILREFHQLPLVFTLLLVAVLPGICEELLFRGFLLHGMQGKCSDTTAIIIVGVLFGIFHLDPYRLLPVSLLGMLFGYMVIKTGSLFTGIVAHCTNNAIAISLSYVVALTVKDSNITTIQPEELPLSATVISMIMMSVVAGIALVVFLVGIRALPHAPPRETEEQVLFSFEEIHCEDHGTGD